MSFGTGIATAALFVPAVAVLALQALRYADDRHARATWGQLGDLANAAPARFDPAIVAHLPAPARRYFTYSIEPGTPLRHVAEIDIKGEIGLGTKEEPNYRPMRTSQILAAPHGFVWKLHAGSVPMRISGSDGYFEGHGWTRFWLLNLIPVVRAGGGADFARSAAARGIAEALFWTPAALLPGPHVTWDAVDEDTARVLVDHRGERYTVDLTVAADGRPLSLVMPRWSRENPQRQWRFQPFGGTIEAVGSYDGYRVATQVHGGNHFGTDAYFPFYRADVTDLRFR